MPSKTRRLGDIGEKIAIRYLKNKGYLIIETNYWKKLGEIDIVSKFKNELVFFEVKTRNGAYFSEFLPEHNITPRKIKKLQKMCELYLLDKNYPPSQKWRIDVLALTYDDISQQGHVKHFENAIWEQRY